MPRLSVFRDSITIHQTSKSSVQSEVDFSNLASSDGKLKQKAIDFKTPLYTLGVFSALLIIGAGIPTLFDKYYHASATVKHVGVCSIHPRFMIDCFPDIKNVTMTMCLQWDCCWGDGGQFDQIRVPYCYHRLPSSYRLMLSKHEKYEIGEKTHKELQFPVHLKPYKSSISSHWIDSDYVESSFQISGLKATSQRLHLRMTNNATEAQDFMNDSINSTDLLYDVNAIESNDGCVNILVQRRETKRLLFSVNCVGAFIAAKNYTEMTIVLPQNSSLYGLGFVNKGPLQRSMNGQSWLILSNSSEIATEGSQYGAHPQYLIIEPDGNAHGVIFDTNEVMHVRLLPTPALVIRVPAPMFDIHIALGPRPADVVSQLSNIFGVSERPYLPPYWALGYHLCPVGNLSLENITKVFDSVSDIPVESHCVDTLIYQKMTFEDDSNFIKNANINAKAQTVKSHGRKLLAVAFPQVAKYINKTSTKTYAFIAGEDNLIFLPNSVGKFWSNVTVFYPDPTNPETPNWMWKVLKNVKSSSGISFDGYILHWNTPLDLTNRTASPCALKPMLAYKSQFTDFSYKTVCLDVTYNNGITHKEMVNAYGKQHTSMMLKALNREKRKRKFLLSLSSHTGSGHLGGIWGGLYTSTWESLKQSLAYVQEAALYGIPLSGVPICGHLGPVTNDLCARWFQIGAFYPLALSFYDFDEDERSPVAFNKAFKSFVRSTLRLRYSLLPYLYTLFYNAHKYGMPVLRPMFFEFPQYKETLREKEMFFWGEGLLFIPATDKQKKSVKVWLPNIFWYEFYSGKTLNIESNRTGNWHTIPSPMFFVNIYIRGGHLIFTQAPSRTTQRTRTFPYKIYVGLDSDGRSNGQLIIDDGDSFDGPELFVMVDIKNDTMSIIVTKDGAALTKLNGLGISTTVSDVRVYGIDGDIFEVEVNDQKLSNYAFGESSWFKHKSGVLDIHKELKLDSDHSIKWNIFNN